ncbi:hypothetical protein ACFSQD_09715 [Flavihumibacter stibioxidans]|uniref:Lipoprotein n=1 Tax=Flavihumibacter stibioxidans TaxID=1834163 RepID=A0ABR7M6Y0_9BACT|nr:hypothetical protein [Flavihumibacter stibioxidans]MBC6490589.1 hypothetical protein [Flavihumibacter stibioxidans]
MKMTVSFGRMAAALLIGTGLFLASCSKNNDEKTIVSAEQVAMTTASAESEAEGEIIFDDVFNNVMGVNATVGIGGTGEFQANQSDQPGTLQSTCFTLNFDFLAAPDTFPLKVTIDFGTTGCTGRDGRIRMGKIITVYTGPLIRPGSVAETSFEGYSVNGIKVEGQHRVENKSTSTQFTFETKVTNGKLTRPNGNTWTWNRTRTITQTDGWGTPWLASDDVFTIVGNGSGTVTIGDRTGTWTSTNVEPLVKRFNCRWIVKGKQAIQRNDGPEGIIDFGTGDCDNKATLTVNGVSREITLK